MTQHWVDVKNADVILILGSNAAENHPMLFKWIMAAKEKTGGATYINVDPRFSRSSAKADIYAPMRSGTDIAFIGGMIKYAIDNGLYNEKYVKECTNALFKVRTDFETCAEGTLGIFSGLGGGSYNGTLDAITDAAYTKTTWDYVKSGSGPYVPELATSLTDPDCVFQKLKKQFSNYTIANVCSVTGTPSGVYKEICDKFCGTHPDDKSATICYAMGTTQHTVGTQNIRAYSILQMLLGNMGVAGGGINAMRGQDNVQGSTDQAILNHLVPGYLKCPTTADTSLGAWLSSFHVASMAVEPAHSYTSRGVSGVNPVSAYWWQNANKYIVSLLKAWWPTVDYETSFNYLPKKRTVDQSMLSIFEAMYDGDINGFICDGENPAVTDPDSKHVRTALRNLDWAVFIDPYETETSAFWKVDADGNPLNDTQKEDINTTVYLLPAAVAIEKYGSRSNSGRWAQWGYQGAPPPGYTTALDAVPGGAKGDLEIITLLGEEILSGTITAFPAPLTSLKWPCFNYNAADSDDLKAEKVAMEMNGYTLSASNTPVALVNGFGALAANGTTASGNWLHCGSIVETANLDAFEKTTVGMTKGNRMKRRYSPDVPNGGPDADYKNIGLHSYWSWCWPVNRRIIYNRASTYQSDGGASGDGFAGDPLAPNKYVLKWVETNATTKAGKWVGDVPDHGAPATRTEAGTVITNPVYPFIMTKEGHGHLFGGWTVAEGPFPWHYEPAESPIIYPGWLGTYRMNPTVHVYDSAVFATHGDSTYDIFATTYRLTEHWHGGSMSRNLPKLNELQPEPFVEMSEDLAAAKGIENGEWVTVSSARGSIDIKACVTKRFRPFSVNGTAVNQVGIIWHWGYMTINPGPSANILTPFIGDANTRIQESKAFMVNIVRMNPQP